MVPRGSPNEWHRARGLKWSCLRSVKIKNLLGHQTTFSIDEIDFYGDDRSAVCFFFLRIAENAFNWSGSRCAIQWVEMIKIKNLNLRIQRSVISQSNDVIELFGAEWKKINQVEKENGEVKRVKFRRFTHSTRRFIKIKNFPKTSSVYRRRLKWNSLASALSLACR